MLTIRADEIKKDAEEIMQTLAKCLLTKFKDELRKEIEDIDNEHKH